MLKKCLPKNLFSFQYEIQLFRLSYVCVSVFLLAGCHFVGDPNSSEGYPGFFAGLWDGSVAIWSLILCIFTEIRIIDHGGIGYKIGYAIGALALCWNVGLFFGLVSSLLYFFPFIWAFQFFNERTYRKINDFFLAIGGWILASVIWVFIKNTLNQKLKQKDRVKLKLYLHYVADKIAKVLVFSILSGVIFIFIGVILIFFMPQIDSVVEYWTDYTIDRKDPFFLAAIAGVSAIFSWILLKNLIRRQLIPNNQNQHEISSKGRESLE